MLVIIDSARLWYYVNKQTQIKNGMCRCWSPRSHSIYIYVWFHYIVENKLIITIHSATSVCILATGWRNSKYIMLQIKCTAITFALVENLWCRNIPWRNRMKVVEMLCIVYACQIQLDRNGNWWAWYVSACAKKNDHDTYKCMTSSGDFRSHTRSIVRSVPSHHISDSVHTHIYRETWMNCVS